MSTALGQRVQALCGATNHAGVLPGAPAEVLERGAREVTAGPGRTRKTPSPPL
jgi:hypothetical protein